MSKVDKSYLKNLLLEQLVMGFEIVSVAEKNNHRELQEISIHYIFDLLDWGRRNLQLSDSELLKSNKNTSFKEDVFSISVKQLETSIESKFLINKH